MNPCEIKLTKPKVDVKNGVIILTNENASPIVIAINANIIKNSFSNLNSLYVKNPTIERKVPNDMLAM